MKTTLQSLILLYPKAWRNRYENEFKALLDDVSPTWRTFFDVFGGALKMQMKIWNPWKIIAAFAIVGVVAAVGFAVMMPDRFVSTAIIKIGKADPEELVAAIQRVEGRGFLAQLINEEDLYKRERTRVPMGDVMEQMRQKDILIRWVSGPDGRALSVSYDAPDAAHARRVATRLSAALVTETAGSMIDPASLPLRPTSPRRSRIIIMGLIAGLLVGALFALFHGLKVWKLATAMGAAGAVLFAAGSYILPERFVSSAVLGYRPADKTLVRPAISAVTSGDSLQAIVAKYSLYPNDARAEERLREHLHVQEIKNGRAILIQFDYPDQQTVRNVTQEMVGRFIKENWNFEILDAASFPQTPIFPDRSKIAGMGLLLGFTGAVAVRFSRRSLPVVAAR